MRSLFFSHKKWLDDLQGNSKPKTWFSHTSTKDTRGVSNIEGNGTDDTAIEKKNFLCKLRRHFHQEMFLLLMNLWLHKFLRNINNKEPLILFISTSNVVFTSNAFLPNFFHRHLCD